MPTFFKYAPRMADFPEAIQAKALAAGLDPAEIDHMLAVGAEANGQFTKEQSSGFQKVMRWYFDTFHEYEREHDPDGVAAATRNALIASDFNALCPSIPNVTAATFDEQMNSHGRRPVLLFFYCSPGCNACIPLAQSLEALVPEQADVKFMKINKNTDQDLFDRFWAKNGIPLMIMVENQSIKAVHMGNVPLDEVRKFIDDVAGPRRQSLARYEAHRKSLAEAAAAAEPVCVDGVCEVRT